jgi:hypothetical protein
VLALCAERRKKRVATFGFPKHMSELVGIKKGLLDHSVAMIGDSYNCYHELNFLSDANLYEYSTLILDPAAIDSELRETSDPPFDSRAHAWLTLRSEQLTTWVSNGHTLVFIVRCPKFWPFEFDNGYCQQISVYELPIFAAFDFKRASGSRVDFAGRPALKLLIEPHLDHFEYEAIISGNELEPILRVRTSAQGENQLVGGKSSFGKGQVIGMPPIGTEFKQADFLKVLAELPRAMFPPSVRLPDWVNLFCAEPELMSRNTISALAAKIQSLELEMAEEQDVIARFREMKCLFAGTGEEFKEAVKAAFNELGLNCVDGPHPRADLLATDGKRIIVVEAKGLDGPARERNFRQVQSWKAEVDLAFSVDSDETDENPDLQRYAAQLKQLGITAKPQEDCKGILVIGTFKSTPLSERISLDFPENLVRLLVPANVCGITGLQLFGLVLAVRKDPGLKPKIASAFYDTAGLLNLAADWGEFLKQV